jgi:hypothetical protein
MSPRPIPAAPRRSDELEAGIAHVKERAVVKEAKATPGGAHAT